MDEYEEMKDEENFIKIYLDSQLFMDKTHEEHNNDLSNSDISLIEGGNNHYFCHKCGYFPFIQFENQYIIFTCKCGENKVNLLVQNEILNNININESMSLYNNNEIGLCEEGHKFRYYCSDCHKNLCKLNCQKHLGHSLINFDFINFDYYSKVNELISNLSEKLDEKSYLILNSDENTIKIQKEPFFELIRIIIDDYLNFPNYSHFFNIDSIYRYLKNELSYNKYKKE